jgi:hypothetical protein
VDSGLECIGAARQVHNDSVKHDGTDRRIVGFRAALFDFIMKQLLPRYIEECVPEERERRHYRNIAELIAFANRSAPSQEFCERRDTGTASLRSY